MVLQNARISEEATGSTHTHARTRTHKHTRTAHTGYPGTPFPTLEQGELCSPQLCARSKMSDDGFVVVDAVPAGSEPAPGSPQGKGSESVEAVAPAPVDGEAAAEGSASEPVPPVAPGDTEAIITLRLPSGKETPLVVGQSDHAGLIRQILAELPDTCCETSYELHLRASEPDTPPSVRSLTTASPASQPSVCVSPAGHRIARAWAGTRLTQGW